MQLYELLGPYTEDAARLLRNEGFICKASAFARLLTVAVTTH
jgi:hypothetical protein